MSTDVLDNADEGEVAPTRCSFFRGVFLVCIAKKSRSVLNAGPESDASAVE